jgi:SAM-dependent methyltransferase
VSVDQDVLKHEAYASHQPLAARQSIYHYQRPAFDLPGFALERLGPVDGPVLDVGWGTGTYTSRLRAERPGLRVIPVDLSIGMGPEVVGEVDRPPFATGSAGAVLAMHMLYHATDPRAALSELRRVLRTGTGRLLVSTNADDDKLENGKLWREALVDLGVFDPPPYPFDDRRFSLRVAERLITEVFEGCEVHACRTELVVPAVEPVLAYVDSMRTSVASRLPAGLAWDDFLAAAERRIRTRVERAGAFVIKCHAGVITATA